MSQARFKYKLALKILMLFIFIAPVFWIVLDPAGQRWADVTLLRVLGNPPMKLDFAGLTGNESVDDITKIYADLEIQCDDPKRVALNQVCGAGIASVNQLPARDVIFYFQDGRLNRIKLTYRAAYHEELYAQLAKVYGTPVKNQSGGGLESAVVQWRTGPGMVIMKAVVSKKGDNQLFWVTPGYEASN